MAVTTTAYSTYITSLQTADKNGKFAGFTGDGVAPSGMSGSQQYPSLAAIEAAFAVGQISAAQRQVYKQATLMAEQTQIDAARQTLRQTADPTTVLAGNGDVNGNAPF